MHVTIDIDTEKNRDQLVNAIAIHRAMLRSSFESYNNGCGILSRATDAEIREHTKLMDFLDATSDSIVNQTQNL